MLGIEKKYQIAYWKYHLQTIIIIIKKVRTSEYIYIKASKMLYFQQ